jgi:hypothetical protein
MDRAWFHLFARSELGKKEMDAVFWLVGSGLLLGVKRMVIRYMWTVRIVSVEANK